MEQAEKRPFIPRAPIAQSDFHHRARGSTGMNKATCAEEFHRPHHEFLSDKELSQRIDDGLKLLRELLTERNDTERWKSQYGQARNRFVFADLYYLAAIGRLPQHIDIKKLETELPDVT